MSIARADTKTLTPAQAWREDFGLYRHCLAFSYDDSKRITSWPNSVTYEGRSYLRSGYDSDVYLVYYKTGTVAKY